MLAKQIATIDNIAGGRVVAGFGAGWFEDEFVGYGNEFPSGRERLVALEEMVELCRAMWSEDRVTYQGRYTKVVDVVCEPKPQRRVPILIGGSGERYLMAIAARHADIWNNLAVSQPELPAKIEALHRRCDDVGRDAADIEISQQCTVVIAPDEATAREHLDKAKVIYGGHMGGAIEEHGIWGTPAQVIEHVERHRAMGCSSLQIEFFGRDTTEPATLFAEEVIPHFR